MKIQLTPHAYKQYKKLPQSLQLLLQSTVAKLVDTPNPPEYKKLSGREGYRLRYGDYRIIYKIDSVAKLITIESLAHRKDV
jgi:mRNA interferase RelE/StbE